jgi:hypothetical protein
MNFAGLAGFARFAGLSGFARCAEFSRATKGFT